MSKTIDDLRAVLFDAIDGVKSGSMPLEKAKMISELSQVLVNTAKVEVDYVKKTDAVGSGFLETKKELPAGITGSTIHKIR